MDSANALSAASAPSQRARAALDLARALAQDLALLLELDERLASAGLIVRLLGLPLELSSAGETELALAVARAFGFAAPSDLDGDIAVILARAGRRDEALAQLEHNLSAARNPYVAEAKAGDTYRALGELDAAEAYYRRALAVASNPSDRNEAVLRITSFLLDAGREAEAQAFVTAQGRAPST
jgi:tetratricopeptide (TPR) repeat protein